MTDPSCHICKQVFKDGEEVVKAKHDDGLLCRDCFDKTTEHEVYKHPIPKGRVIRSSRADRIAMVERRKRRLEARLGIPAVISVEFQEGSRFKPIDVDALFEDLRMRGTKEDPIIID